MKPSSMAVLLLFLIISEAQGIRLLEKGLISKNGAGLTGKNGGDLLVTMKRKVPNMALRRPYSHWLPGFQEDYHGPRSHKSRHH